MVGREMGDPIGSEFGIVTDEITYGADLETAMRNLYARIGSDDLPLFVTAVAIQGSTGGNLGEILCRTCPVSYASVSRCAAISCARRRGSRLGDDPLGAADRHVLRHSFGWCRTSMARYGTIPLTKELVGGASVWMVIGNLIMFSHGELQDLIRRVG